MNKYIFIKTKKNYATSPFIFSIHFIILCFNRRIRRDPFKTSNYTTTVVSNSTTDREPEEILSEGDAVCEAYAITGPKNEK